MLQPHEFTVFAPPSVDPVVIEPTPRLESWMRHDHPDQVRLREYLGWLTPRLSSLLAPTDNVLSMTIAVPSLMPLDSGGADLDNYLLPVARALDPWKFVSVSASKERADHSTIAVAPATRAPQPDSSFFFACAESSKPKDSADWKKDIDAQIRVQVQRPLDSPVEVQIAFVLEPSWNWALLWKPTVDALGAIVGEGPRPFNTHDDRIVRLSLNRTLASRKPRRTSVGVWWRAAAL